VTPSTMRAARLHGIGDVRVESLPVPEPAAGEVLVRVEACGVCPTDARKYAIGVNDGEYPFNPGHEWVGRVVEAGEDVQGLSPGDRVYGDTYGGYAEFTTIAAGPGGWSRGALPLGDLPVERAVFLEPLADCLHAVHDQAQVADGHRVAVLGAGSMGLQMVAAAARAGARVMAVEPREDRRALAARFGAELTVDAAGWREAAAGWTGGKGPDSIVVTLGRGEVAADAVSACGPGGRVVLFAGFGNEGVAQVDLNRLHYKEISLVGSEWVGVPPHQRFDRYEQARELLAGGELRLEELVSERIGLDGVEEALRAVRDQRTMKIVLYPDGVP
jgi:L-iditol 2-dehydrogenase